MKNCLVFIIGLAIILCGCGKITHEVVGESDVHYTSDPVIIIVTGNYTITLPEGRYIISGNELIII